MCVCVCVIYVKISILTCEAADRKSYFLLLSGYEILLTCLSNIQSALSQALAMFDCMRYF